MSVKSAELAFKMTVIGPSPEERDKVQVYLIDYPVNFWFSLLYSFILVTFHQALEFRKFWGEKATLRQFRDSRIAEVAGLVIDILLFLLLPDPETVEIDIFLFLFCMILNCQYGNVRNGKGISS